MIKILVITLIFVSAMARAQEIDSTLEQKINLTLERKAEIDLELAKTDESIHQLETLIREKRKILLGRLRALSYLKDFKWGALFALDEPTKFERNLKILSKLNQYDISLFKDYKSALRNLAQGRHELISFKKELDNLIQDLKTQELALAEKESNRSKILAAENKKSLLLFKGKMPVPSQGQIKWAYGSRRDDQNEYSILIHGLLFETRPQEKIRAIGPGRVIFRDQILYWGETLIVQHDDNYYSVYAGVQNAAALHSQVKMNDVVAVGSSKEFYFELRHFENPINPKPWLKENL